MGGWPVSGEGAPVCPSPQSASLRERRRQVPGGGPVSVGCACLCIWNLLFSRKLMARC